MPYPGGTRRPSQDRRHHLEANKARARDSLIDVANAMAVLMRRELAQHGARSVAFVKARIITGQPARRLLNSRMEEEPKPQYQKHGKGKSPGKGGKAKAKHTHSMVFKMVPSAKVVVSEREKRAPNLVTSEPSVPLSKVAKRNNPVLSGNIQSKTARKSHNVFSCDSIHDMGGWHIRPV